MSVVTPTTSDNALQCIAMMTSHDNEVELYKVTFADTMSVVIGEHTLATDNNFLSDNDVNDSKR